MLNRVILWSLQNRLVMLALTFLLFAGVGLGAAGFGFIGLLFGVAPAGTGSSEPGLRGASDRMYAISSMICSSVNSRLIPPKPAACSSSSASIATSRL